MAAATAEQVLATIGRARAERTRGAGPIRTVELPFAGGTFRFGLGDTEILCLEHGTQHPDDTLPFAAHMNGARGVRIGELIARVLQGRFEADGQSVGFPGSAAFALSDLDIVIRAGLLGGGGGTVDGEAVSWDEYDVGSYMRAHVSPMSLPDRWDLAVAVLSTCLDTD